MCTGCGAELHPYLEDDIYGRWQRWQFPPCRPCDARDQERWQKAERIASLGLAPRHAGMTFEAYEPVTDSQRHALERVRAGGSLWLVGLASKDGPGTGTGKSHLSVAACIAAAEAGAVHVEYHVAPELYARLRGEAMSEGMEDTVRDLCECDLLVLDDLDKGRKTPLAAEVVYRIAEERSVNGRRTLVTTNSRPGEVAGLFREGGYGPAIVSRLRGLCDVLTVEGPDHRLTARPEFPEARKGGTNR